jgi:DNA-3-methyladenine glycosylase
MKPLDRKFYNRDTLTVAKDLLGCMLVHDIGGQRRVGRIVETEAYDGPMDQASHAASRRTPRNDVMFGPPGFTYVYLIYGMYHCFNLVTGPEDYPAAVLIRALEPVAQIDGSTQGPGRLSRAMGITLESNRLDATVGPLFISASDGGDIKIVSSPRICVDYAGKWASKPFRYVVDGRKWVSKIPNKRTIKG